jgi:hypothetical protein
MRVLAASLVITVAWAGAAAAQPAGSGPGRVSVWAGATVTAGSSGGVLPTDYAPVLQGADSYTSHATQQLSVNLASGLGVDLGADIYFSRRVGLELGLAVQRATVTGSGNSDYVVHLQYVSRQPPDYVPREYTTDTATPWPDTTGSASSTSVQIGLAARAGGQGSRVEGTVSGGLSLCRVDARIESVAYTAFWMGGHATLFSSQHRVAVDTSESGWFARPYLSGDVGVRVAGRTSLVGGVRVVLGSTPELAVRPDHLVDPGEGVSPPDLTEVQRVLAMGPLDLVQPRWRVVAGVRIAVGQPP